MKIRNAFVSNSSSSSYVCDITGEAFEVRDSDFAEVGLAQCEAGHVFKDEFLPIADEYPSRQDMLTKLDATTDSKSRSLRFHQMSEDELKSEYVSIIGLSHRHCITEKDCPVCSMTKVKDSDLAAYLLKTTASDREMTVAAIRKQFGTYKNFKQFISKA